MNLSKRIILGAGVMALLATSARAQEIHFAGNTAGCFYTSTVCVPATLATQGGLTYKSLDPSEGFQFDDMSDEDGYLPVGGPLNNFGKFTLTAQDYDYSGWNFMLQVMFTAPPGVSAVNYATLHGTVVKNGNGLSVDFSTTPVELIATDGTVFDLTIHQSDLTRRDPAQSVTSYVNGELNVTATPEPATVGLMMLGLAGLVPVALRRRQQTRNQS